MVDNAIAEHKALGSFPRSCKVLFDFSIRNFSEVATESGLLMAIGSPPVTGIIEVICILIDGTLDSDIVITHIHKLTPFSHGGRQKLPNVIVIFA